MCADFSCDVAVVGGGPAGATAAFLLARQGLRVRLYEKQSFPRPKLCAGLLTWKTLHLLESIFSTSLATLKADGIIKEACRDYRIYFGSQLLHQGRLEFPFHFVQRQNYDHYWLCKAGAAGARIHTATAVQQVDAASGTLLTATGDRVRARLIVGADGVWSRVRRAMDHQPLMKRKWLKNMALTIETHIAVGDLHPLPQPASLYFGFVPWGYGWSFPGPNGRIIGMGALGCKNSRSLGKALKEMLAVDKLDLCPTQRWQSHPLPYGNFIDPPAKGRILLIGDACGLADPLLGEGIYYAHRSAQLAARAIVARALQPGPTVRCYNKMMKRRVLRELRWIRFYRGLLFLGGLRRRYRGLKLFTRLFPQRLEAAVQGHLAYSKLLLP